MNSLERVLDDDVARLMERLAAAVSPGAHERVRLQLPPLRARLDRVETTLAELRVSLLEDYGRWQRSLEDIENLWALGVWRAAEDPAAEEPAARAA